MDVGWWKLGPLQCGREDLHEAHEFSRGDVPPQDNPLTCVGVRAGDCTAEYNHEAHLYDEDGQRYFCDGRVVEPEPEPRYPEEYCRVPGGCKPHVFSWDGEIYWCPGGSTTAEESEKRARAETRRG